MRTRTATVVALTVLALLGGCSAAPGDAAVVDDRHISVAYLEQATEQLAPLLSDPSPAHVLAVLVMAPVFIDAAAANGVGVSADDARGLLDQAAGDAGIDPLPQFGGGALEVAWFSLAAQNLQGTGDTALLGEVGKAAAAQSVQVNPRYGEFDPATGLIVPSVPEWIAAGETP